MDPRTGLGRYQDYRISNYQLMMDLVEYLRTMSIADILELDDVKERIARYFEQNEKFKRMLAQNAEVHGNAVLVDLRYQDEIYTGNRFLLYSLFPEANISVQVIWGLKKMNTVITVGHSILNRTSRTDVGRLMLAHGGGGHRQVGTCQVPNDQADRIIKDILEQVADQG
jgi:nanoRNase/pAp phosphatase (c-di-AMP/oligoRNAs hydrolase)